MKEYEPWSKARIEDEAYEALSENDCVYYLLILRNAVNEAVPSYSYVKIWKKTEAIKPILYITVYGNHSGKEAVKMKNLIYKNLREAEVIGHGNPIKLSVGVE